MMKTPLPERSPCPFLKHQNVSDFSYPQSTAACWSIIKKDSYLSVNKSPAGKRNSTSPAPRYENSSSCRRLNLREDDFSDLQREQATPFRLENPLNNLEQANGFSSKKLLNFGEKGDEGLGLASHQNHLKDILGANNFLFSPSPFPKHLQQNLMSQKAKETKI